MGRWIKTDTAFSNNKHDCALRAVALVQAALHPNVAATAAYECLLADLHPEARDMMTASQRGAGLPAPFLRSYLLRQGLRPSIPPAPMNVNDVARRWPHPAVILINKHLTTIIDGNVLDTWDTRRRRVKEVWTSLFNGFEARVRLTHSPPSQHAS